MRNLLKKGADIDWQELSPKELAQYKKAGRKNLLICSAVFFAVLPAIIVSSLEIGRRFPFAVVWICLIVIIYVCICFCDYAVYFAGKPRGIRYGRVSKKISRNRGRYWGYLYNVYFEDIHKSITNVAIQYTKGHPVIMRNDRVKVIRSRLGAFHIVCVEREQSSEQGAPEGKK